MFSKRTYHYNSPVGGAVRQALRDPCVRSIIFTALTVAAVVAGEVYAWSRGVRFCDLLVAKLRCAATAQIARFGSYLPKAVRAHRYFVRCVMAETAVLLVAAWWAVHRLLGRGRTLSRRLYKQRVDGKTLIVTGANAGLGLECARHWALRGGHVVMCARDINRGVAARDAIIALLEDVPLGQRGSVEFVQLDLADNDSVRAAAGKLSERNVHCLMNNAGVMGPQTAEFTNGGNGLTGQEMQVGVNHMGHFLLTALLLPTLKRSGGRVVNVSSFAHVFAPALTMELLDQGHVRRHYDSMTYYGISKLCNVLFTKQLQKVIDKDVNNNGLTVYTCHPGVVATSLARHMFWKPSNPLMWPAAILYNVANAAMYTHTCYPSEGAATQLRLALEDKRDLAPAQYYCQQSVCPVTKQCNDPKLQADLWVYSSRVTGLAAANV